MFGTGAGLLALALVVFEPNLLAHGAMVTTDIGAACFLLATIYAFYRYVKAPSLRPPRARRPGRRRLRDHQALGHPARADDGPAGAHRDRAPPPPGAVQDATRQALRFVVAAVVVALIAAALIWACYGFRYQARPDGWQLNPPMNDALRGLAPLEARGVAALARWRLLPES